MAFDTIRLPLATIGGALVILLFCIFTLASVVRYPGPFSPMDNWLSDLGTAAKNPYGYVYFNIGCILAGVSLLLVIAGLQAWHVEDERKKLLLTSSQACGALSAFALMLVGAFDEGTPYHLALSVAYFLLQFLFIILVNFTLWGHPAYYRWIGYYAVVVAAIEVAFVLAFIAYEQAPVWEWLTVFSALLWIGLLAYNTARSGVKLA